MDGQGEGETIMEGAEYADSPAIHIEGGREYRSPTSVLGDATDDENVEQ